jgi:O-antigen/teichoic acid export membrane protein
MLSKRFSKLQGRFASNAFWMFLGTFFLRGSNLIAGVFIARLLGKEIFGQYGVIQSSVLMISAFGAFGLGITSTKFVAEYRTTDKSKAGRIMVFCSFVAIISGVIMGSVMFFGAPFLAGKILGAPELEGILKISSLLLFFAAFQGAQNGSLVGVEAFRPMAFVNMLTGVTLISLTVWGAYSHGLFGAVWGWVCATILQSLANTLTLWRVNNRLGISFRCSFGKEEFQLLWRFSLPAALGGLMFGPVVWAGNAILVNSPEGFAEMGRYNAGYQWFSILLFLPGVINNALLPMLSHSKSGQDSLALKKMFRVGFKCSFIVLGPLCLTVILISPFIMSLYGESFHDGWVVMSVLSCSAFVAGVQNLIGNTIAVMDKMWLHFKMNIFWGLIFIISSWIFVDFGLGATGLAFATLNSYSLRLVWALIVVRRIFKDIELYEQHETLVG